MFIAKYSEWCFLGTALGKFVFIKEGVGPQDGSIMLTGRAKIIASNTIVFMLHFEEDGGVLVPSMDIAKSTKRKLMDGSLRAEDVIASIRLMAAGKDAIPKVFSAALGLDLKYEGEYLVYRPERQALESAKKRSVSSDGISQYRLRSI